MAVDVASRLMAGLMTDYGLTREQAAGFVGNLAHESAGFRTLQEVSPLVKGSRGGYGYAQWTGPRRRQFEAWSQQQGLDPSSFEANYGFLRHELDTTPEGRVIPKLKGAQTVEDATRVVSDTFLRPGIPHMGSRLQWAQRVAGGAPVSANADNPQISATPSKAPAAAPTGTPTSSQVPTPTPTVAGLLGAEKPRVTALLAALSEAGQPQQQQPVDPRQMFAANYAWARQNGWRV